MTATSTRPQFSLVMSGLSLDGDSDMSPSDGVKRSKSELVLRGRGDTPEQLSADEREHFRNKRLRYVSGNSTLSVRILNAECFPTTLLQSFFYRYRMRSKLLLHYFCTEQNFLACGPCPIYKTIYDVFIRLCKKICSIPSL